MLRLGLLFPAVAVRERHFVDNHLDHHLGASAPGALAATPRGRGPVVAVAVAAGTVAGSERPLLLLERCPLRQRLQVSERARGGRAVPLAQVVE